MMCNVPVRVAKELYRDMTLMEAEPKQSSLLLMIHLSAMAFSRNCGSQMRFMIQRFFGPL